MGCREGNLLAQQNSSYGLQKQNSDTDGNYSEKPDYLIIRRLFVSEGNPRQLIVLGRTYYVNQAQSIEYFQSNSNSKWGGNWKTLTKFNTVAYKSKFNYSCQLHPEDLETFDSIHRESIRIYTGAFKTSPIKALHVKANKPPLNLRINVLGQKFQQKLKSNSMDKKSLVTLDERKEHKHCENEKYMEK